MRTPSIAALESAFPGRGTALKFLLTNRAAVLNHPAAVALMNASYHPQRIATLRLEALDAEAGTYGVECMWRADSDVLDAPAFEYLNNGDPYVPTIVRFASGTYAIRCWGNIVERGDYK